LNSTQQRNFEESIEQCAVAKNPTLTLTMKWNSKENEIPNSISTLTHSKCLEIKVSLKWHKK
jgi:hypothetical protein